MGQDVARRFGGSMEKAGAVVQAHVLVVVATQDHMVIRAGLTDGSKVGVFSTTAERELRAHGHQLRVRETHLSRINVSEIGRDDSQARNVLVHCMDASKSARSTAAI